MMDWKNILLETDDEYLIGLSNKGTVKRAYKDKEDCNCTVGALGEEAEIHVGKETVHIRMPLGESNCTCPSGSICRHIILGIIVLKEYAAGVENAETMTDVSSTENELEITTDVSDAGNKSTDKKADKTEQTVIADTAGSEGSPKKRTDKKASEAKRTDLSDNRIKNTDTIHSEDNPEKYTAKNADEAKRTVMSDNRIKPTDKTDSENNPENTIIKELMDYPPDTLKKKMGVRRFGSFVNRVKAGVRAQISGNSVITVKLPDQDITVKLLSPLEYSTCTCHKKELCAHKAEAIFWYQIQKSGFDSKDLETYLDNELGKSRNFDVTQIKAIAGQLRIFLEKLMNTGLSRTSSDMPDSMERMAVICHNAELADFEGYFRALHKLYDQYIKRSSAFQIEKLMSDLTRLYRRVELLIRAESSADIAKYAGIFKAEYMPVGELELTGVVCTPFKTNSGYEGVTIYFLEENTGQWYSYTVARPVFYEANKKRGRTEKETAPWGIKCSLEELQNIRIRLIGAKCDTRRRLSSSQETKGEIIGKARLTKELVQDWYYQEFDALFADKIGKDRSIWLRNEEQRAAEENNLIIVWPQTIEKAVFLQQKQLLQMKLYDSRGQELILEVAYSELEDSGIRYLEKLKSEDKPCFLGKIYLRNGRIYMYPITVLKLDFEREETTNAEMPCKEIDYNIEMSCKEIEHNKEDILENLLMDVQSLLTDLLQSGFDTVHDSTLEEFAKIIRKTKQFNMTHLSEMLSKLQESLSMRRHIIRNIAMENAAAENNIDIIAAGEMNIAEIDSDENAAEIDIDENELMESGLMKEVENAPKIYTQLNEYLYLCLQKTAYDKGWEYYVEVKISTFRRLPIY